MFFRIVFLIMAHKITVPDLIANYDHAGHSLIPMSEKTWEKKGSKQVSVQAKGDKRQVRKWVSLTSNLLADISLADDFSCSFYSGGYCIAFPECLVGIYKGVFTCTRCVQER